MCLCGVQVVLVMCVCCMCQLSIVYVVHDWYIYAMWGTRGACVIEMCVYPACNVTSVYEVCLMWYI